MPINSQVEVKQVRLVKGTGSQIEAARQAGEILETDLVAQTDAPDLVPANTAITGGTKCKITYDEKGLVTAGADLASTDVTNALGYTPYNSSNPDGYVTSSALTAYELKATIQTLSATDSITLADNTIYNGGEQTALTIALPATDDVSFLCEIDFTSGATPATLSYPNTIKWLGDDVANNVFIPVASKRYTIICAYDGVNYRFTVKGVA